MVQTISWMAGPPVVELPERKAPPSKAHQCLQTKAAPKERYLGRSRSSGDPGREERSGQMVLARAGGTNREIHQLLLTSHAPKSTSTSLATTTSASTLLSPPLSYGIALSSSLACPRPKEAFARGGGRGKAKVVPLGKGKA